MKLKLRYYSYIVVFFLCFTSLVQSAVHTRLAFVSNTPNSPSAGVGTLVLDVEAISDNGVQSINAFQDAIQLDATFRAQNPSISYSNQLFPAGNYTTTQQYTSGTGRIRYVYTYSSGARGDILTTYTRIVRITIQYTMATATGSINWFDGNPNFFVTNSTNTDITGNEDPITSPLTDITLPVELSTFNAQAAEGKVILSWATQSEVNNLGFEVYRAQEEAGNYAMIASYENNAALQGAGNSNEEIEYQYEDASIYPGATFWYQIADVDFAGVRTFHGPIQAEALEVLPTAYALRNNYPNPFNPSTTIRFEVPANVNDRMEIVVYNALGMKLKTLVSGRVAAGVHEVVWDGTNQQGLQMASGMYFIRMVAGKFNQVHKMILLK